MQKNNRNSGDLNLINDLVFKACDLNLTNLETEAESQEYSAQKFKLKGVSVLFRQTKITPTKTGQFVTLWKRNPEGLTVPFDLKDDIDLFMIAAKTPDQFGVFIFPKAVLHQNRILSEENRDGKRGFRVYPFWDETTNKQAKKTQFWQTKYFLDLSQEKEIDLDGANLLFTSN